MNYLHSALILLVRVSVKYLYLNKELFLKVITASFSMKWNRETTNQKPEIRFVKT